MRRDSTNTVTWTQRVARALLHRHALAERSSIERRWVRAGARAPLHPAAAADVAGGPVCPGRPASVHCMDMDTHAQKGWRKKCTCTPSCHDKSTWEWLIQVQTEARIHLIGINHSGVFEDIISDVFSPLYLHVCLGFVAWNNAGDD